MKKNSVASSFNPSDSFDVIGEIEKSRLIGLRVIPSKVIIWTIARQAPVQLLGYGMRPPVQLGCQKKAAAIEAALKKPIAKAWQRQRLQAMHMAAQGQFTLQQIADAVGAGRSTVAGWLKLLREKSLTELLQWKPGQGAPARVVAKVQEAICAGLATGQWRRARDLQLWLKTKHQIELGLGGVYYYLGKAGGVLKVPRKTHAKKDAVAAELFKGELAQRLAELALDPARPVRIWMADEHRYGLISVLRRCWALRGQRVTAPYQTKYQWGYLHSALELDGEHRAQALFSNSVNLETSTKFLEQIQASEPEAQHVVIWDRAGFHPRESHPQRPPNVHVLPLPAYSPELNAVEKIGAFIKDAICNQVWKSLAEIEAAISAELEPLWTIPARVQQLVGTDGWLADQLNASAKNL